MIGALDVQVYCVAMPPLEGGGGGERAAAWLDFDTWCAHHSYNNSALVVQID
jgi:hypothetical protein